MAVKGAGRRVQVSDDDRSELERIVRAVSSEVRMVERARIVLGAAEGRTAQEIAGGGGGSLPTGGTGRGGEGGGGGGGGGGVEVGGGGPGGRDVGVAGACDPLAG